MNERYLILRPPHATAASEAERSRRASDVAQELLCCSIPMTTKPAPTPPDQSLTRVLGQSEQVQGLVEAAAEELSTANDELQHELDDHPPAPAVESALEMSEAAEGKVREASEKLTVVNEALKVEVAERHRLEGQLAEVERQGAGDRHAAMHDPLTGLPNRALFLDRLELGLAQARRQGWKVAVLFADLDKFKAINDTYGHAAGDAVLRTIAERLKDNSRSDDTVSRFGGDEFLCLMTDVRDDGTIERLVQKTIALLQQPCDLSLAGRAITQRVEASFGIAVFPRDGSTADALIRSADAAMYAAKQSKAGYAFAASGG
jgi:diguanylate cyclase